jgi:hypothetical protein
MPTMTPSDYIALAGLLIAAATAIGTIISGRKTRKEAEAAGRAAQDAQQTSHRMAEETARIQALDWTSQHFRDVRAWGTEVTNAISDLIHLSHIEDAGIRHDRWNSTRARISALIDRGRWHFPNEMHESLGLEKPPAYRGSRQNILDWLVWAYDAYPKPPLYFDPEQGKQDAYTAEAYGRAVSYQREFVSEIQRTLNPRERHARVSEILERFRIADSMRDPSDAERRPKKGEQGADGNPH